MNYETERIIDEAIEAEVAEELEKAIQESMDDDVFTVKEITERMISKCGATFASYFCISLLRGLAEKGLIRVTMESHDEKGERTEKKRLYREPLCSDKGIFEVSFYGAAGSVDIEACERDSEEDHEVLPDQKMPSYFPSAWLLSLHEFFVGDNRKGDISQRTVRALEQFCADHDEDMNSATVKWLYQFRPEYLLRTDGLGRKGLAEIKAVLNSFADPPSRWRTKNISEKRGS